MDFLHKPVHVGNVTMKAPSLVILALAVAASMMSLFAGIPQSNFLAVYFLLIGVSNSYTLNCVIDGECKKWSMFLFIGNVLIFALPILGASSLKTMKFE